MATEKRLIDANAVKKVFDNLRNETFALEDPKTAGVIAGTVITCGILIDEIPTVDAVEVVHGEWSTIEDDYCGMTALQCSECNQEYWFEDDPPIKIYNYCPNCGANMRGSE